MEENEKSAPSILLWGGRSKAHIIQTMIDEQRLGRVEVVFDPTVTEPHFPSSGAFVSDVRDLAEQFERLTHFVVCIGGHHGFARVQTGRALERIGLAPLEVHHPVGFVEPSARLGAGSQTMPGATIHKFTSVGDYCIFNTNSTVDHDCRIGDGVHVMGGAAVAGIVTIEDFATIGTNATVAPRVSIGEESFVGAGAVVLEDVPPRTVVVGNPARHLRAAERTYDEATVSALREIVSRLETDSA